MKEKRRVFYESPTTNVVEINVEGLICISTRDYKWNDEVEE